MKLVANALNGCYLANVLPGPDDEVDYVLAAIAYGSNSTNEKEDFIGNCLKYRHRLDLWMRYDHTVPVAIPLMQRLLRHERDNIFCKFIPDRLHSKVIWWKGYGAYIGSANLTDRAWYSNIETGVFLDEQDLQSNGTDIELDAFFDELRNLKVSIPLSSALIEEMEAIDTRRGRVDETGKELRKTPVWEGPAYFEKKSAFDKRRDAFRTEWHATLTHLEQIGDALATHRPRWIDENVPIGWQIDQFLHAYYYNHVGDGQAKPVLNLGHAAMLPEGSRRPSASPTRSARPATPARPAAPCSASRAGLRCRKPTRRSPRRSSTSTPRACRSWPTAASGPG